MKKIEPKIPSGFMELLPQDQYIFNDFIYKIKSIYESFGFLPIETPSIEFTEILLTKSGGETEKQIWNIKKADNDNELSLHFDLTVPLARYVAQRQNDLTFPFKRYQIQKVWRGERPQKGRFREFYQCDADIIDINHSILSDAEIIAIVDNVFKKLNINILIRINNRKILNGFLQHHNCLDKSIDILRIIDKMEKYGKEKVIFELKNIGLNDNLIKNILEFIQIKYNVFDVINKLKELNIKSDLFLQGIEELCNLIDLIKKFDVKNFEIDLSIARGLDYYTGTVFETNIINYNDLGSVCSGGSYDNLTDYYTDKKYFGVGMSIGLTRLFYVLKNFGFLDNIKFSSADVLIINTGCDFINKNIEIASFLRKNGIKVYMYTNEKDISKQIIYANKLNIPYVIIIKEDEIKSNKITIKDLNKKEQYLKDLDEILFMLKK